MFPQCYIFAPSLTQEHITIAIVYCRPIEYITMATMCIMVSSTNNTKMTALHLHVWVYNNVTVAYSQLVEQVDCLYNNHD